MRWKEDLGAVTNDLNTLHRLGLVPDLPDQDLERAVEAFPVRVPPHIVRRIEETDSNALRAQFLPDSREVLQQGGWPGAFFSDEIHPVPAIAQKYPNRLIIYLTHSCAAFCRHCNRKSYWRAAPGYSRALFDQAAGYIREHSSIEEVIVTGGDPLTLDDRIIAYVLSTLRDIQHIKVIRLGTRVISCLPNRITPELCKIIAAAHPIVVSTQINHPDEFCSESTEALSRLAFHGIRVLNQITLLKGVNDSFRVMRHLLTLCSENGIQPYYLFHCFNVEGVQHFRTPVDTGLNLIRQLTGRIGGCWIPKYCLIPHTTGVKVPFPPDPVVRRDGDTLVVRDFTGREIVYE
jgi:lysine 2,3-aminomutase